MQGLSEKQQNILIRELERGGLTYAGLQNELLDHLTCCIEEKTASGMEFFHALKEVREEMGPGCIRQIQEDTLLLINLKYKAMKKLMYIMGILAPVFIIFATFFKVQHWPGAGALLVTGWSLLAAAYLPLFIIVRIRDTRKENKKVRWGLYIAGMISGIIIITGTLFKIMHWPGAGIMLGIAGLTAILVFIPVLIISAVNDKVNPVQSFTILVFALSFLALITMTFVLNISKSVLGSFSLTMENNTLLAEQLQTDNELSLQQLGNLDFPLNESIKSIVKQSEELSSYLIETMQVMVIKADPHNSNIVDDMGHVDYANLHHRDDPDAPAEVMLGSASTGGRGPEVAAMMENLRTSINALGNERLSEMAGALLNTAGPDQESGPSWLSYNFEHLPLASVLVQLSDIRVNAGLVEAQVLGWALNEK